MAKPILTQSRLKEVLHYCPETGVFTWRVKPCKNGRVGSVAGNVHHTGYVDIGVDYKLYRSHRLAWLYIYGEFPPDGLDHINRVKTDNRIANLRPANQYENGQNQSKRSNNTSGHPGVVWHKASQKWMAKIMLNRKTIYLGIFTDITDAIAARKAAELRFHTFQNSAIQTRS